MDHGVELVQIRHVILDKDPSLGDWIKERMTKVGRVSQGSIQKLISLELLSFLFEQINAYVVFTIESQILG